MDEPTCMSMNIFRARVFQILNQHYCSGNGSGFGTCEDIRSMDGEIIELMARLPWYFQLDDKGHPPRMPEPLCEVLTWQNHILRTCVSTQRIRMYRQFLAARIEGAWENVMKAAEDALVVYRFLRTNRAPTSHQKFYAQAYQILSVAVTIAALLLVEGRLPIHNVRQQIKDMAMDLKMLEDQGCPVPIATHGRQIVLKMLALCDSRTTNPNSPEDAQRLVPDICIILGGENTTRAYMHRLAEGQMQTPTTTASPTQQAALAGQDGPPVEALLAQQPDDMAAFSPQSSMEMNWTGVLGDLDPALFLEDARSLGLLSWDMTGILADAQSKP